MKRKTTLERVIEAMQEIDSGNYISLDSMQNQEEDEHLYKKIEIEISQKYMTNSPEYLVIEGDIEFKKNKLFESLSSEAKEIIDIITDCPLELKEICLSGNLEKVSMSRFMDLVKKQWGETQVVKEVFKEVFKYANKVKKLNIEGRYESYNTRSCVF